MLTVNTVGKNPEEVQQETLQVLQGLDFETIASTVPGITGAAVRGGDVTPSPTITPGNIGINLTYAPTSTDSPSAAFLGLVPIALIPQLNETSQTTLLNETPPTVETTAPTITQTQTVSQTKQNEATEASDGIDWWRWLIFALVIVVMLLAIYFVHKKCGSQPNGGKESVKADPSQRADDSQSEDQMGRWD